MTNDNNQPDMYSSWNIANMSNAIRLRVSVYAAQHGLTKAQALEKLLTLALDALEGKDKPRR